MFGYSKTNDVLGSVNRGGAPIGLPCIACKGWRMGKIRKTSAREKTADTGFPRRWRHGGSPISHPQ